VWEWCFDRYGPYEKGRSQNPIEVSKGVYRVLRGGSWYFQAGLARSARRDGGHPGDRDGIIGFRVVVGGSARTPFDR
jgi:formylglycine-generating enzyme required for sulfatase activity